MSQFLAPVLADAEEELERSLRPRTLSDFVGQERVKEQLSIALEAAKQCGQNWLPEIHLPRSPNDFFAAQRSDEDGAAMPGDLLHGGHDVIPEVSLSHCGRRLVSDEEQPATPRTRPGAQPTIPTGAPGR